MHEPLTSPANPLLKKARKVLSGHRRAFPDLCAAEGVKVVAEALAAAVPFDTVLITERLDAQADGRALHEQLRARSTPLVPISQELMASLSEVGAHQGVVALARRPVWSASDLCAGSVPWLIVLIGVQDPGNLGTILRTCEAVGVSGVIASRGTVDPFNAKALRASMGSAFRVPQQHRWSLGQTWTFLGEHGVRTVAAAGRQGLPYTEVNLTGPLAIILGGEGYGLMSEVLQAADTLVHIPMSGPVDSLNVAISAAVLLYEARRQRQNISGGGGSAAP